MERRAVSTVLIVLLTSSLFMSAFFVLPTATGNVWMSTDWNRTYGGTNRDVAKSVVQTSDGGYALAGFTFSYGPGTPNYSNMWLVKTDSAGTRLWDRTYGGTSGDMANSLVQTGDGGYALAGYTMSYGAGGYDFWLIKTDASGNVAWNKTYGGAYDDAASSLVQTSDGGYALAGYTYSYGVGTPSYDNFWLVKTDSAGNHLWNKTYGGIRTDSASSVVQTSDGGYALAGCTGSYGAGDYDFWLVKTDSAGTKLWDRTYGGTNRDVAYSLVQTGDGGYALAGYTQSYGAGSADFWLVKTDSAGTKLWNRTYGGTSGDCDNSLVQTGDGGYALAGYTNSYGVGTPTYTNVYLVKTYADGTMAWNRTYGGTANDEAYSLVQTSDGGYALAGYTMSYGAGDSDAWLVKLTPATIYVRADGSVDPPSAPILRNENLYTLTDNIYTSAPNGMVIEKDGITLDGAGYRLQGLGGGSRTGILLQGRSYVTIRNLKIKDFGYGIYLRSNSLNNVILSNNMADSGVDTWLSSSSDNTITGNIMTGSWNQSIILSSGSSNNAIRANKIENSTAYGIGLYYSSNYNSISGNNITNNLYRGIYIASCSNNKLFGNRIKTNGGSGGEGIRLYNSTSNAIYHNNFINNGPPQASTQYSPGNIWDEGYPSGGNYWSDYTGSDLYKGPYQNVTGSDGIGDTSYVIDVNNRDNYPLMGGWAPHFTQYSWAMFHHDLSHAGYSESPTPRTNQLRWSYATGASVYSSPAVAGGKVYVGSLDNRVYCVNALNGTYVWSYATSGPVYSSPAVADGKVYVASYDSRVFCLDALTGAYVWDYSTGSTVGSSPAVADGKVYVASTNGRVYCLDALTGGFIWSYLTGNLVYSSPAVVGGKVYIGSYDSIVYCLDALTGAFVWAYPTGGYVHSSPAVVDGKVYVGSSDSRVYCLSASTGAFIWSYLTGSAVLSSPAVADGKVYVGSRDNKIYCIDASTGGYVWSYLTGFWVDSSPAVADRKVYVGSLDSNVYCLDALNGAFVWSYGTSYYVYSSPSVADGVVFIGSYDSRMYAFGNVIKVPEDYPTVQAAVNAAPSGATIIIAPGVYHEAVTIMNKTLTILGEKGSGTTFTGGGSGTAFNIGPGADGTNVAQVTINNYAQGISIDNSAQCRIFDNIMYSMTDSGVALKGSNAANTLVYNNIFQNNYIAINLTQSSTSNTVYGNTISYNNIGLILKSGGNTIYANTISKNNYGIKLLSSNDNFIYWNNFDNYVQQVDIQSSTSAWDKGYPMGGNYWSDYLGVDSCSGPTTPQTQPGRDGIGDTPYTVYGDVQDQYPLMKPFGGSHDIGIVQVTCSKTIVGQGYTLTIQVTVLSYGIYTETRNIKIYANTLVATGQDVSLAFRHTTTITFTWDTTSFAKSNYNIKAYATPITDDTDTNDNTGQGGTVLVTIAGDVNGDKIVNAFDLYLLGRSYGLTPPSWNPNADINNDQIINKPDLQIISQNYGKNF